MWTKELRHFRTWKRGDGTDRAWLTEESKGEDTRDSCRASDGIDSIVVGFWDFAVASPSSNPLTNGGQPFMQLGSLTIWMT